MVKRALAVLVLASCGERGSILALEPDDGSAGGVDSALEADAGGVDAALESGPPPLAIVLVDTTMPSHANDPALEARLVTLGFTVQERLDTSAIGPSDHAALIVVSSSSESAKLDPTLADQAVPLLVLESFAYAKLGMTGPLQGQDFGVINDTAVDIVDAALSGLPLGNVIVYTQPTTLNYAQPAASALVAARIRGAANQATTFGYLAGAMMASRTAPARRAGVFLRTGTIRSTGPEGWVMFDAVVRWAVQ
jgi:hypothetical protein